METEFCYVTTDPLLCSLHTSPATPALQALHCLTAQTPTVYLVGKTSGCAWTSEVGQVPSGAQGLPVPGAVWVVPPEGGAEATQD